MAFVRNSLGSIWALELLLLIRRYAPNPVTYDEIVRELRATPFLVRRIVERLAAEHLVAVEDGDKVRFQASTPEQERLCGLLEVASRDRPIALRAVIVGAPDAKLRNFADAFRFSDKNRDENKDEDS